MASVKLDDCAGKHTQRLDCMVLATALVGTLVGLQLLLTCLAVTLRLLQLTGCNLIKTHADQVVRIDLRNRVGFLNELEAPLAVELALVWI